MPEAPTAVGLIGAGTMGSRMARALLASGRTLVVWDISAAVRQRERDLGAIVVDSAREAGEQCDVVLLSLPLPHDVQEVVAGEDGLLSAHPLPGYVVDLSTVDPETSRTLSAASGDRGVRYLDAPVLGRPARCGQWTLPVGGAAEDVEAVRPVLNELATVVRHVGPVGTGNAVKLLNNLMFGAINAITVEVMAAAVRVDLDPRVLFETIVESGAATVSDLFREIGPKILAEDWSATFSLALLEKDNRLGVEMSEAAGARMVVARVVQCLNSAGVERGLGPCDTSALIQLLHDYPGPQETTPA